MNQLEDNLDMYFKSKVDKALLDFNKEKAWERLQQKRTHVAIKYVLISIGALLLAGFIMLILNKSFESSEYIMSDFEKRQKLNEYETKIAGTYVETLLCYDCVGEIMTSQVKQVSENQMQVNVY